MTPPEPPLALRARGVAAAIGGRYVLLDLDLELRRGERLAIAGVNGAGKSTLLDLLGGQRVADAGQIELDGVAIDRWSARALCQRVAWLGHQPGLYLDLSARENLVLFAALSGRDASAARVDELLDRVGLRRADADRPLRGYSRGMAQRAGIGRLLAVDAGVWLLDEPTTGLDREGRDRLDAVLAAAAAAGRAIVLVSHEDELLRRADRLLWLRAGRLSARAAVEAA